MNDPIDLDLPDGADAQTQKPPGAHGDTGDTNRSSGVNWSPEWTAPAAYGQVGAGDPIEQHIKELPPELNHPIVVAARRDWGNQMRARGHSDADLARTRVTADPEALANVRATGERARAIALATAEKARADGKGGEDETTEDEDDQAGETKGDEPGDSNEAFSKVDTDLDQLAKTIDAQGKLFNDNEDRKYAPLPSAREKSLSMGAQIVQKRSELLRTEHPGHAGAEFGAAHAGLPLHAMMHFHVEEGEAGHSLLIAELAWTHDLDHPEIEGRESTWAKGARFELESAGVACPIGPVSLRGPVDQIERIRAERQAALDAWTRALTPSGLAAAETLLAQLETLRPVRLSVLEHTGSFWTIEALLTAIYNAARTTPGAATAEVSYHDFIKRFIVQPKLCGLSGMESSIASAARVDALLARVATPADAIRHIGCDPMHFATKGVRYPNALAELLVLRRVRKNQREWARRQGIEPPPAA